MQPERSTDAARKRASGRRWAAIGGVVLMALLVGGALVALAGFRDDRERLGLEPSPTPMAEEPLATPSPEPSPEPTPTPAPTPQATPSPTPTPTEHTAAWIGPELISTRDYHDVSLVLDSEGNAHVAAAMGPHGSDGIWYVTNASGDWLRERLSSPAEGWLWHQQPAIATDADGSLWVVYTEASETASHLRMLTNRSGTWSSEAIPDCECIHPSLAVAHGVAHLVGEEPPPFEAPMSGGPDYSSVIYMTNAGGSWSRELVAAPGSEPALGFSTADTSPHIIFRDGDLRYAEPQASGGFTVEDGPGGSLLGYPPQIAIDPDGVMHVIWGDASIIYLAQKTATGWSSPAELIADLEETRPTGSAVSPDGTLHITATGYGEGVWYARTGGGQPDVRQLATGDSGTGLSRGSDVAIDAEGRPHLIYVVGERGDEGELASPELWYAIGPGD